MASLLERLKYIIEDIFGKKTYAESQRDKYKKVVRNLEKELKKTDNLSDVMDQLATDYNTMEMNPDSAQGKLSDTFVTKVNWKIKFQSIHPKNWNLVLQNIS